MRRAGRVVPNRRSKTRSTRSERTFPPMPSKCWSIGFADACRRQEQICTSTRCVAWAMCSQTKQQVSDAQSASPSLWIRLIIGLVSVSLLAVGGRERRPLLQVQSQECGISRADAAQSSRRSSQTI